MKSDLNGTFVFSNHEEEARRMAKILNVNFFVQDGDRKKITRSAVTERKISYFFKCHVKGILRFRKPNFGYETTVEGVFMIIPANVVFLPPNTSKI